MWKTYSGDVDVLAKRASDGANSPGKKREECERATVVGVEGGGGELQVVRKVSRLGGLGKTATREIPLARKKEGKNAGIEPGSPSRPKRPCPFTRKPYGLRPFSDIPSGPPSLGLCLSSTSQAQPGEKV